LKFADFRKKLGERTLQRDDGDVAAISSSPYFFVRTTLSVLLSMVKTEKGATQEHAVGNSMLLIPVLWDSLRQIERWQIGQAYAEVNAAGNRLASAGMKKALVDVRGFDFVPETLRSSTFTEAAAKVLTTHFAMNNYYNEREPMQTLANLGSSIPMPAFAKCMEATLAVYLGNYWGHGWAAEPYAIQMLATLRPTQWSYYFNECLSRDRTVLDKLATEAKPIARWQALVNMYVDPTFIPTQKSMKSLLDASRAPGSVTALKTSAAALRAQLGT
jgi:hypothetical protein